MPKTKSCIVCLEERRIGIDYDYRKRICKSCETENVRRCKTCNTVKHLSSWYKGNKSGPCIECKLSGRRRHRGFKGLSEEVQKDILELLDKRANGERITNTEICMKHGINMSTFCTWLKKGLGKSESL